MFIQNCMGLFKLYFKRFKWRVLTLRLALMEKAGYESWVINEPAKECQDSLSNWKICPLALSIWVQLRSPSKGFTSEVTRLSFGTRKRCSSPFQRSQNGLSSCNAQPSPRREGCASEHMQSALSSPKEDVPPTIKLLHWLATVFQTGVCPSPTGESMDQSYSYLPAIGNQWTTFLRPNNSGVVRSQTSRLDSSEGLGEETEAVCESLQKEFHFRHNFLLHPVKHVCS